MLEIEPGICVTVELDGVRHTIAHADCREAHLGDGCDTLVWDPPWDARLRPVNGFAYRSLLAFCDGQTLGRVVDELGAPTWQFVWDCVTSWVTPGRPLKRHKSCLWYGAIEDYKRDAYRYGPPRQAKSVKNTRGQYTLRFNERGVRVTDLFIEPITRLHGNGRSHPHAKPQEWIDALVLCCGVGAVYDPCAGGGSTLRCGLAHGVRTVNADSDLATVETLIAMATAAGSRVVDAGAVAA